VEVNTFVLPQNFSTCWPATACTLNFVLLFRLTPSWGKLCDAIRGHGQEDHQTVHGLEVCELGLLTWVGRRLDRGCGTTLTWGHKASTSHGLLGSPSQRLTEKTINSVNRGADSCLPSFWLLRDEMLLLFRALHTLNDVSQM
jgi:hypothetical protein